MWKASNEVNAPFLFKYNKLVVVPFFRLWLSVSREQGLAKKLKEADFWEKYLKLNPIISPRFLNNNKSSTNQFKPLLASIVLLGSTAIEKEWKLYLKQNRSILEGNYDIVKVNHAGPITKFFKDYLYDFYWGKAWVWTKVVGVAFNRANFHTNFKTENNLTVCSYCDLDTIAAERNSWVEHFLPKDHFPLIACNPRNLIPCCTACNVSGSGKGTDYKSPVYCQFNTQIGDASKFIFDGKNIDITVHQDARIENFIELLKLRSRYKQTNIHASIISRFKTNYGLFIKNAAGAAVDKDAFIEYVRDMGRHSGHYFVHRDLLDSADIILPKKV
jgi:hypothetical protein